MKRIAAARPAGWMTLLLAAAFVAPASPTAASTAEEFLTAPVWYLQYEVTITSKHQGARTDPGGTISFTSSLTRVMTDTQKLNLRSQGPGPISMTAMAAGATGQVSQADAQKLSMEMLSQMDHTANWLVGGAGLDSMATEADIAKDSTPSSPSRVDYVRVDTGRGLIDEMGNAFDLTRTTTVKGEGNVLVMGFGAIILEMDTAKKTYALSLPIGTGPTGPGVTHEVVTVIQYKGKQPEEDRKTSEQVLDFPSGLELEMPDRQAPQGGVLIRGTLEPASGKISGTQTYKAHYPEDSTAAPVTVVFKYTLTMTPPRQ